MDYQIVGSHTLHIALYDSFDILCQFLLKLRHGAEEVGVLQGVGGEIEESRGAIAVEEQQVIAEDVLIDTIVVVYSPVVIA